jgi:hypothetical protein
MNHIFNHCMGRARTSLFTSRDSKSLETGVIFCDLPRDTDKNSYCANSKTNFFHFDF